MGNGKITDKQQEILEYMKEQILSKGYPPSVREICSAVHLKSTSSVHSHLETLEKNGYTFNLTRRELVNVPILGSVAAGQPLLANDNINGYFPLPPEYVNNSQTFMLTVKGESMINAGIFDGDLVVVEQTPVARNGEIIVALIEDSATVKTFYKENDHIRLQPENDSMDPILVKDCMIIGRVIGLYRRF